MSVLDISGELLVDTIERLAILEACLWHIHEALASSSPYASFFCREYWGTSASQAQLALDGLLLDEPLKGHVRMACSLESLSLGVISHQSCRWCHDASGSVREWLCNLVGSIRGNCLALMSLVRQQWIFAGSASQLSNGHCPANLDFNILSATRHFRQLCGEGEHVAALHENNTALWNMLSQLCKPGILITNTTTIDLLDNPQRSADTLLPRVEGPASADILLSIVADTILALSTSLTCYNIVDIRGTMLRYLRFCPCNGNGLSGNCSFVAQDPYQRFGTREFATDGPIIWFEPLPPIFSDLNQCPRLPFAHPGVYTLVLDLDETLVHHSIVDGNSFVGFRPGVGEFLRCTRELGFELVVFTAATQNYADACIDMVDPNRCINHRLYRQHALSWGPVFVKDLSRLGRPLSHTLIIDNIADNFMLQPHNGIYIYTWIDDPTDTALSDLVPILRELITTQTTVPAILEKYKEYIPLWAGWKNQVFNSGVPLNANQPNMAPVHDNGISREIKSVP